jgi:hypothetical protein
MSEENVELVRAYIEDVNRGDWVTAGTGFMHDDVEIDWSRSPAPYRGIYRGREAALRFAEELQGLSLGRSLPNSGGDSYSGPQLSTQKACGTSALGVRSLRQSHPSRLGMEAN